MEECNEPDEILNPMAKDAEADADQSLEIRDIIDRLQSPVTNPVTRARIRVEMEIPEAQRGPGWDRHWRELEAYAEAAGVWSNKPE